MPSGTWRKSGENGTVRRETNPKARDPDSCQGSKVPNVSIASLPPSNYIKRCWKCEIGEVDFIGGSGEIYRRGFTFNG